MLIVMLCSVFFNAGCDKTEVEITGGSVSFSGKVNVSPTTVKVGDEVTFSIDNSFSIGNISGSIESSTTINGKDVVKCVVYYIDGDEIGKSSDKNNKYALKYKVSELTVGNHNVTAHCESNFKNIEIAESISSGTLIIEE